MSEYKIQNLNEFKDEYLQQGVFLVLLDALKVPPHLLWVVSGKVFSITTFGPSLDKSIESYLQLIRRKSISSIFINLSLPDIFTKDDLLEKVRSITKEYNKIDVGIATCLSPIKDFCGQIYDVDKTRVSLVFDLLDQLKEKNSILGYYQLYLDQQISNGEISLKKYSIFEVNEAIHEAEAKAIV